MVGVICGGGGVGTVRVYKWLTKAGNVGDRVGDGVGAGGEGVGGSVQLRLS